MRVSFSVMRLWAASLLTLGVILIQCAAQADIGPLKETYDGGRTWQPEGTGRSSQGGGGGGSVSSAPAVSPEEAARQEAQAEEQRKHSAANNANDEGLKYQKEGNWEAAAEAYERALQNWDHEIIRKNLEHAKEEARYQKERVAKEKEHNRLDAAATVNIKESVNRLVTSLGGQSAAVDFDGSATGTVKSGGGLDFITDSAAVLPKTVASNIPEPNTDPNVVDLRGAKTLTVEPARVKGTATTSTPQQQNINDPASEKFIKATGEVLRDSLNAKQTGNSQAKAEVDKRIQKLSQEEAQRNIEKPCPGFSF